MFLRFYSYPYLILMILTVIPQLQFVNSFSLRNGMIQRMKMNRKMVGTRLFQTNPLLMEQAMKERMKQLKVSPNSTFLLNVSGGSDSMALFHMFRAIHAKYWKDMKLKVVNFNHKARKEADDEVFFVFFQLCFLILFCCRFSLLKIGVIDLALNFSLENSQKICAVLPIFKSKHENGEEANL